MYYGSARNETVVNCTSSLCKLVIEHKVDFGFAFRIRQRQRMAGLWLWPFSSVSQQMCKSPVGYTIHVYTRNVLSGRVDTTALSGRRSIIAESVQERSVVSASSQYV